MKFTAVVLAADRGRGDVVAEAAGVPCKSLTPIGGHPDAVPGDKRSGGIRRSRCN